MSVKSLPGRIRSTIRQISQGTAWQTIGLTAINFLAYIVETLVGLLIARSLPIEEYGKVAYYSGIHVLLTLIIGLGLTSQVALDIANTREGDEPERLHRAVSNLSSLRFVTGLLTLGAVLLYALVTRDVNGLIVGISAVLLIWGDFLLGVFRGFQKINYLTLMIILRPIIYMLWLAPFHSDATLVLAGLGFSNLAVLAIGVYLATTLPIRFPRSHHLSFGEVKSVIRPTFQLFSITLAQVAYTSLGNIMIGIRGHYIITGIITVCLTLVKMISLIFSQAVISVYFPTLVLDVFKQNLLTAQKKFRDYYQMIAFLGTGGVLVFAFFAEALVLLLYTDKYREAILPLRVLAPLGIFLVLDIYFTWTLVAYAETRKSIRVLFARIILVAGFGLAAMVLDPGYTIWLWISGYLLTAIGGFIWQIILLRGLGLSIPYKMTVQMIALGLGLGGITRLLIPDLKLLSIPYSGNLLIFSLAYIAGGGLLFYRDLLSKWVSHQALAKLIQKVSRTVGSFLLLAIMPVSLFSGFSSNDSSRFEQCQGILDAPNQMTITCEPGYYTVRDVIEVYSAAPLGVGAQNWLDALNYDNSTWLFRVGGGPVKLLIQFYRQDGRVVADLYDDRNGDGELAIELSGMVPISSEGQGTPTVRVTAQENWWLDAETLNFNLDMEVDGQIVATNETYYMDLLSTDGVVDYFIHVRDANRNGVPDVEWRQVYPGLPEEVGFYHTLVMVNTLDNEPALAEEIMWPFVGAATSGFIKSYGAASRPPVGIDWQQGKVAIIHEAVASRGSPNNYFIYSIRRIEESQLNQISFESPFAFYNYGGVNPYFPDLSIRMVNWPVGDFRLDEAVQQVDLTWRYADSAAFSAPNWDYRVGLMGRNAYTGVVSFPEFSVQMTPYEQLPEWILGKEWDYGTLVVREAGNYLTTEHIYEWSTLEGVVIDANLRQVAEGSWRGVTGYVRGESNAGIEQFYQQIRPGLRGEFASAFADHQPRLYLSPVDLKIHLYGASQGVWNIDGTQVLRYADMDGDGFFDQWVLTNLDDAGTVYVQESLYLTDSLIIYAGQERIIIRQWPDMESIPLIALPIIPESWREFAPYYDLSGDFSTLWAHFNRIAGPEIQFNDATRFSFHHSQGDEFRMGIATGANFTAAGLDLGLLTPGRYQLTYDGLAYQFAPLTPAQLSLELTAQMMPTANATQILRIQLKTVNQGMEDSAAVEALLQVVCAGESTELLRASAIIPGAGEVEWVTSWQPGYRQECFLSARLLSDSAATLASAGFDLPKVLPADSVVAGILRTSTQNFISLPAFGLLALMGGLTGSIFWLHRRFHRPVNQR